METLLQFERQLDDGKREREREREKVCMHVGRLPVTALTEGEGGREESDHRLTFKQRYVT